MSYFTLSVQLRPLRLRDNPELPWPVGPSVRLTLGVPGRVCPFAFRPSASPGPGPQGAVCLVRGH